ncbi:hypothetical protein GRAN_4852 [Granulicella sibirica]|uniref:Uncharacterized protein n=1 Tax=Granulicella sibirica TaxID=2479048 RepID=A0A4Q0SYD5_9BACT|nr:hypothetical protein GRAN_4852 [Granulicella sibirica]
MSGGLAFQTTTNAGQTSYLPLLEPLVAVPLGEKFFFESRAAILEDFFPSNGKYDHSHFAGFTYAQVAFLASPRLTLVAGDYLLPFNVYNERLSPVWISNLQDSPLMSSIGLMSSASGLGGMARGKAVQTSKYSIDYAAFFSARSGNQQFGATRAAGGRVSLYVPAHRLEAGLSYDRSLQGPQPQHENFYGAHVWWEPKDMGLRFRSEFARGHHAQGYWIEADYRTWAFGGLNSWVGRIEPVFRMQQTFRRDNIVSDGVPLVNTQRADFGLNYNLPHNVRILTSYSRQFSSSGDHNIWETSIVYRYLFPAWKEKSK